MSKLSIVLLIFIIFSIVSVSKAQSQPLQAVSSTKDQNTTKSEEKTPLEQTQNQTLSNEIQELKNQKNQVQIENGQEKNVQMKKENSQKEGQNNLRNEQMMNNTARSNLSSNPENAYIPEQSSSKIQCPSQCLECSENEENKVVCTKCKDSQRHILQDGGCNCHEKNQYYKLDDECTLCGVKGCIQCQNKTCKSCNKTANYFLYANGKCQKCSQKWCQKCENQTTCKSCMRGYFLDEEGVCKMCSQTGCLSCKNLDNCLQCNQTNNYFLYNGQCSHCFLTGCSTCQNLTSCQKCDEKKNYFLENSICHLCQIEGCQKCKNNSTCSQCSEGFQLQNGQCMERIKDYGVGLIILAIFLLIGLIVAMAMCLGNMKKSEEKEGIDKTKLSQVNQASTERDLQNKMEQNK